MLIWVMDVLGLGSDELRLASFTVFSFNNLKNCIALIRRSSGFLDVRAVFFFK